ncbi:MAG TPA: HdeD family acid-resistance protein [Trueperaceae bacterium]|nr:HdeD family acid-resistance protein [Trueperaceae bacterium]
MLDVLASAWWSVLLRGILFVLLGIVALVWPGITLFALIYVYAFFALGEGIFSLVGLIGRWNRGPWWAQLLGGLFSLAAGVIALVLPGITAMALLYLIAGWAFVRGIMDIVVAIALRKEIDNEWLLILAGIISIAFGVVLAVQPGAGMLALVWLLGIFGIAGGISLIGFSLRLRSLNGRKDRAGQAAAR